MAGRRTRTNTITPGNMPPGKLNPAIGFGGEGRRSLCAVRCRDAAIYRRLESVPVEEMGVVVVVVGVLMVEVVEGVVLVGVVVVVVG